MTNSLLYIQGKVEDRKPILVLFNHVAMEAILDAAG